MVRIGVLPGVCLSVLFLVSGLSGRIDGGASAKKVKVRASASKPDPRGNQIISVTLKILPGWHLYANPVEHNNETYNPNKTTLSLSSKVKLEALKIEYPPGILKKDGKEEYKIYEGEVTIRAAIRRAKGDTGPLEWSLDVFACNDKVCLPKGVITFTAP